MIISITGTATTTTPANMEQRCFRRLSSVVMRKATGPDRLTVRMVGDTTRPVRTVTWTPHTAMTAIMSRWRNIVTTSVRVSDADTRTATMASISTVTTTTGPTAS